ncbi:MAG TPA: crotonase/enoyl-CoA hydratase family protein [Solirubrobacteraceae bacterium]|nr:crotonase/enoyl-CoA hydratase family protein [Solirubrobacteraceae bacterium]
MTEPDAVTGEPEKLTEPEKPAERVTVEVAEHIAVVTLTRPDKHNALDLPMLDAIIAAAERLRGESGVRVVVLHGAGKSFCSGLDFPAVAASGGLEAFTGILDEPSPNYFQRAGHGWIDLPVPVIAAIHGSCLGGGLQIALAADIRIATADARLSVMEGRWGLIPDMSITRTLPRLVGIDVAKELTYTARTIGGDEAQRLGLVTRLADDPLAAAMDLAHEVAGRSPDAVRRAKRLFDEGWAGSAAETLALEATLQGQLIGSPNQLAAMTAAFTKQQPEFTDP